MSVYGSVPEREAALAARLARFEQELRENRGANGLESAVIGAGGLTVRGGGGITVAEGGGIDITGGGGLKVGDGSSIVGTYPDGAAAIYFGQLEPSNVYESGIALVDKQGTTRSYFAGLVNGEFLSMVGGRHVYVRADTNFDARANDISLVGTTAASINAPQLALYSLPTTSAAANLHLGTVGGVWTVAYVTSSRRYKRDIRPTAVKPENVLAVEAKTFLEKSEVEAVGAAAPWRHGFIAEDVHELTPQFVGLDEDGDPNSVDYDRFAAIGHQVVLQDHEARLAAAEARADELAAENAALKATLADVTTRLEALEA